MDYDAVKEKYRFNGTKAKAIEGFLKDETFSFLNEDGKNKKISLAEDPLEFATYAFMVLHGSALRASKPIYIEE